MYNNITFLDTLQKTFTNDGQVCDYFFFHFRLRFYMDVATTLLQQAVIALKMLERKASLGIEAALA